MALNKPDHFGKSLAGQVLEWMPTDTPERFQELMRDREHRQYFQHLGWDQPGAINYAINTEGFRCAEFTDAPCVVALGCSYTMGIGLPLDTIWPELVGKSLGLEVANLSWGGYSADTCFRLAEYWLQILQPVLVVMMAPPASRFEIMLDPDQLMSDQSQRNLFEVVMPASESQLVTHSPLIQHWFGNVENHRLNNLKNRLAVQQLCQAKGIACIVDDVDRHMWWSREQLGYARDFLHGGPGAHRLIADWVLNEYQSKKPS